MTTNVREVTIEAVLAGQPRPFGPGKRKSAIAKLPVEGPAEVTRNGLPPDAQGDRTRHGGSERAVHHYPAEHYAAWQAEFPQFAPHTMKPGAFGENISTRGLTEWNVCVGDVFRAGTALLQVSQGRQPCWKLSYLVSSDGFAGRVQDSGRTGWFYRVLEPGTVSAGDMMRLEERLHPDWPLSRVLHLLYIDPLNEAELAAAIELPELASSWKDVLAERVRTGKVESWTRRLTVPAG